VAPAAVVVPVFVALTAGPWVRECIESLVDTFASGWRNDRRLQRMNTEIKLGYMRNEQRGAEAEETADARAHEVTMLGFRLAALERLHALGVKGEELLRLVVATNSLAHGDGAAARSLRATMLVDGLRRAVETLPALLGGLDLGAMLRTAGAVYGGAHNGRSSSFVDTVAMEDIEHLINEQRADDTSVIPPEVIPFAPDFVVWAPEGNDGQP
jgi:hypothetical protein